MVVDLSEAILLYLRHYPGSNEVEFESHFGRAAATVEDQVRAILSAALKVEPDWNRMSLNEAGDYVEAVMHERFPNLMRDALEAIGNYYTYQVR